MRTYRVGIIGLGRMGSTICDEIVGYPAFALPYSIAGSVRASDRLELACGCDLLPEKRDAFRERWGTTALYDDFRKMIEAERPDLVAICTKGENHAELGVACAELGVPMMYLEKAMACSMTEADALRDAIVKHGTAFNTGVLRRFDERYWWARQLIERGEIGRPHTVVQYSGGGLLHGGIHIVDTMMYFLGDPQAQSVRGELRLGDITFEHNRFSNDPSAVFEITFEGGMTGYAISGGGWDIEVFGTEGSIRAINNGIDWSWRKPTKDADKWVAYREAAYPQVGFRSSTINCLEDLVAAYEEQRPTLNHIAQCHHSMEICMAVAESHVQGSRRVELPLANRDLYVWHV